MIPISLTLKGLYSYQTEQTIDFSRLLDGQVFGIFGAVGSGKSTILEAISFALYGETERLNQRDNRNYNMMNLKSEDLLIDFIFANFDNQEYRITIKGRRASNDFDTVRTFQRSAYKKVQGEWQPMEETLAEPIIGLSYDNFRRTIIIPQGKFQEFLQLTDKHRTDMLKEIFHLGKYEFFYQTASLEKKNNEKLQHLQGQMEQYRETSPDALKASELRVNELFAELSLVRSQLQEQEKLEKEQNELRRLFGELQLKREELQKLVLQESHFKEQEKKLSDYEYCLRHFSSKLVRQKELKDGIETKNSQVKNFDVQLGSLSETLLKEEEAFAAVKNELKKQDSRKDQLNDYRQILSILELEAGIEELNKRMAAGEGYVKNETAEREQITGALEGLKNTLKGKKTALPDMKMLTGVNSWFLTKSHLDKAVAEIEDDIRRILEKASEPADIADYLPDFLRGDVMASEEMTVEACQQMIGEYAADANNRMAELQVQVNHYQVQVKLGEFTQQLHAGEACPVCGSTEHPAILNVADVNEHLEEALHEIETIRANLKTCDNANKIYQQLQLTEQSKRQQAEELNKRLKTAQARVAEHEKLFVWDKFNAQDYRQVERALHDAENLGKQITEQEAAIEVKEKELAMSSERLEKYKNAVEQIRGEVIARRSSIGTLSSQLKILKLDENRLPGGVLSEKAASLASLIRATEEKHEQLAKKIEEQRHQKAALQERIETTRQVVAEEEAQLEALAADLTDCLSKSSYADWEEIETILKNQLDIDAQRLEIAEYQQQLYKARHDTNNLEQQTRGKTFDAQAYAELQVSIVNLKQQAQQVNDTYVTEQAALERLKSDLKVKAKLEKEMEALQHRAANLNVLRQLFKGSGFINYISSVYMHNLCKAANERFYKLTRQQLRLEVTDSNDFQVRDFLNNGKVRSVKTLSGGQTFQASLSLALALAESVQHQNRAKQNFFFLDEGFGSLDKDSLQIVFDTLKSLRKENRIVGIISHVEDLQQEIDVFLKIENHPETGSVIKRSWGER